MERMEKPTYIPYYINIYKYINTTVLMVKISRTYTISSHNVDRLNSSGENASALIDSLLDNYFEGSSSSVEVLTSVLEEKKSHVEALNASMRELERRLKELKHAKSQEVKGMVVRQT